ncbi:hypothetical protein CONLIGDRAFT_266973 [Coniochaeta ligniaria NRRL 30616]|uniref:Uncharacterized protein n=1 Tax=Coniochaeta ligniaria NRRL 30616 TaxID=1408157 RepID=A0A1J7IYZ0_9PEZI|nr:hypothetical protein CONLIGDRAFT_266973 [Coniochaeta ligniaria NRRL 30616]
MPRKVTSSLFCGLWVYFLSVEVTGHPVNHSFLTCSSTSSSSVTPSLAPPLPGTRQNLETTPAAPATSATSTILIILSLRLPNRDIQPSR